VREVEFWLAPDRIYSHFVSLGAIENCYGLPKDADRLAYWREVTRDQRIRGTILVWVPK
jgi:hypothetical protein